MAIIGIVAVDQNLAIGKGGALPWHYSSDLKFFRRTTTGNACVMGHNTWLSLAKPLPDRLNIVLSRRAQVGPQHRLILLRDLESVLEVYSYLKCDLYVIGGSATYLSFADVIDQWLVTRVPLAVQQADTHMPQTFLDGFVLTETAGLDQGLWLERFQRGAAK